jgi:DNA processing protein
LDARDAWIALASVPGVGQETFGQLIAAFGDAATVFAATLDGRITDWLAERRRILGRPQMVRDAVANLRATAADPAERLVDVARLNLWTLTALDTDYPARLRDLPNPPAVVFGDGDQATLYAARTVGIVGTRRPTPAGRALTARVAERLVEFGVTVVSGLAVGIDGVAHAATLENEGKTVGVIGGGHFHPGPRAHALLRAEVVAKQGALISEYHPMTKPTHGTYPLRNRIIAALVEALIVVEAPRTSGALITATVALELGRPVLVAPGRVGDWSTAGSLALLRDTPARPLVGLDEMIEDLGYLGEAKSAACAESGTVAAEVALASIGEAERLVAHRLRAGPAGIDLLVADTGLGPAVVSSALTFLLMRGWAQPVGPAYVAAGALKV